MTLTHSDSTTHAAAQIAEALRGREEAECLAHQRLYEIETLRAELAEARASRAEGEVRLRVELASAGAQCRMAFDLARERLYEVDRLMLLLKLLGHREVRRGGLVGAGKL
jgi:hypothetical protein